jgi:hypothetical protein
LAEVVVGDDELEEAGLVDGAGVKGARDMAEGGSLLGESRGEVEAEFEGLLLQLGGGW